MHLTTLTHKGINNFILVQGVQEILLAVSAAMVLMQDDACVLCRDISLCTHTHSQARSSQKVQLISQDVHHRNLAEWDLSKPLLYSSCPAQYSFVMAALYVYLHIITFH